MSVLVFVEHVEGKLKKSAFEVVSYAKALAEQTGTTLSGLVIGSLPLPEIETLGRFGASKIISIPNQRYKDFNDQAYASAISQVAKKEGSRVIIFSNSFSARAIAPRIAIKMKAGIVSGALSLPQTDAGKFVVKKAAFSGKAVADVEITSENKIVTVTPNAFQARELGDSTATIETFEPEIKENDFSLKVKEVIRTTDKVSLPEADIVVSGGRGLKGPENWNLIEALAETLGAATACSKPVSDAGWRPHEEHVGQTGITISPNLYIAVGISGAIQHVAGISSSKTIVAINKDPEAPIFRIADYGIVGDAFEVVPALTEAFKNFKAKG